MQNILVLGSAGQIGGALVNHLRAKNFTVIEYDIASSQDQDLRLVTNPELEQAIKDSDFVFFLAFDVGGSHYLASYQDSFDFISNNVSIMKNTFSLLAKNQKPFIFASSTMADIPSSTYGLLKALGEKYTMAAGGLPVKFWNVYGIEHDPTKFHVISDFVRMARENSCIQMRTSGLEQRDFLFAEDCSEGLETLMLKYSEIPRDAKLHLASFEWNTIYQVAEIIARKLNAEIVSGTASDLVHLGIRTEPDPFVLNFWKPKTSLKEGIEKIIDLELL